MAAEMTRRINLEYPDFSIHDIVATDLYYNEGKDAYIMNYYDLTLNNSMYTVLNRVNGRLVKNPFMEGEQVAELALDARPADMGILADNIRCLKVPLKKPETQRIAQFDVFTDGNNYYIRRNLAQRFGINYTTGENGSSELVRVSNEDINRIVSLTRNDSTRLEPIYHSIAKTQRQALFTVLDDDRNLYITRILAQRFGMDHGFALRFQSMAWTKVTLGEIREIEERTKDAPVCLKAEFARITRENTTRNVNKNNNNNNNKNKREQALFRVLDDGENLYVIRVLAKQYGVDHGYAFRKDDLEWTRVSLADVKRIEELTANSLVALNPNFEKINKVEDNLKPTKSFTVVIDVLVDGEDLYVRKEVADRFNINGDSQAYDSYVWVRVSEADLARIKVNYNNRNALVEFKYNQMKKTKVNENEFEVLVDGENQYISIDLVNRFAIDNTGVITVNGKNYAKVSDRDIKKIIASTFYSDNSLTPKYVKFTKAKREEKTHTDRKVIALNYTIIDNMKFVPVDLPLDMELDLMNGKKIRIDGQMYISVSNSRFQEVFNELMRMGYRVTLTYKEVEKINKDKNDSKKITK